MTVPIIGTTYGGASAAIVHQDRLVLAGSGIVSDILIASRTGDWQDFTLGRWRWSEYNNVATVPQERRGQPAPLGTFNSTEYRAVGADQPGVVARNPSERPTTSLGPNYPAGVPRVASFDATAADGFYVAQASGRGNRFHAMLQQEGLFVLGDTGESVVPAGPLTGTDIEVRENSWFGSDTGRIPVIAGGLVIFVQSGGEDIRGIAWTEAQRKYLAASMLTYAGNVFGRAVDMTFQRSTGRQGDTVYVVGDEGDLGVMLLAVGSPHPAWSTWKLEEPAQVRDAAPIQRGKVVGGAAPLGAAAWLVERDGVVALETPVEDAPCADGIEPRPGDRLEGATHFVKRNGRWAAVTDEEPLGADEEVGWIGYPWEAIAETLPWIAQKRTGLQRSVRKVRCLDISLDLIIPRGYELRITPETDRNSQIYRSAMALLSDIKQVGAEVVSERGTQRRKQKTFSAKQVADTDRIVRMRYGNSQGWRDRVGLRIRLGVRVSCAGLSFRMVA